MMEKICTYNSIKKNNLKTVIINCRNCKIGESTIFDEKCRTNIFQILQNEHGIKRLILNHAFVKVYSGEQLEILKELTNFIENIDVYDKIKLPGENLEKCKKCNKDRITKIENIIETSKNDPITAFLKLRELLKRNKNTVSKCSSCEENFDKILQEIIGKAEFKNHIIEQDIDSDTFYKNYIRPYVRPGFIDSYIQLDPPPDAVFLESYEVKRKGRRPFDISLYTLKTRPEKLYFVIPPEYDLPREELFLLEKVRSYLSKHRPRDASFMDAETSREYFQRFGKHIITKFVKEQGLDLNVNRIDYLSDVFARYTAGFGIL